MYALKHGMLYTFSLLVCMVLVIFITVPLVLVLGEDGFFTTVLISMTCQFGMFGAVTVAYYKFLLKKEPSQLLAFESARFPVLAVVALGGLTVGAGPSMLLDFLFSDTGSSTLIHQLVSNATQFEKIYFILMACLVGPIIEEVMFRGVLWDILEGTVSKLVTLLGTTLLFAVMHIDPIQVFGVFFMGLYFGWLRMKTGNILAPTIAHVGNNVVATIVMLNLDSNGEIPDLVTFSMLMVFAASIVMFKLIGTGEDKSE